MTRIHHVKRTVSNSFNRTVKFVCGTCGDKVLSLSVKFEAFVDLDDMIPNRLNVIVEVDDINGFCFPKIYFYSILHILGISILRAEISNSMDVNHQQGGSLYLLSHLRGVLSLKDVNGHLCWQEHVAKLIILLLQCGTLVFIILNMFLVNILNDR